MKEKLTLLELKTQVAKFFHKNDRVPSSQELSKILEADVSRIEKYLDFLKSKDFIIKDSEGKVIVNPEKYNLKKLEKEPVEEDTIAVSSEALQNLSERLKEPRNIMSFTDIKESAKKLLNHNKSHKKKQLPIKYPLIKGLRFILLFVGIGATYLSIHFSYVYLATLLSPLRAFILSLVMVVYGVASFELMALLWMRFKRILAGVFAVLWLVVTIFSMVSTVAGQYNGNMSRVQAAQKNRSGVWAKQKEYEQYKAERKELKTRLSDLRTENTRVETMLSRYKDIEAMEKHKGAYNQLRYEKRTNLYNIQKIMKKIEVLDKNKPVIVKAEKHIDFYMWVAGVLEISPDVFQFWLSLFPALFIDLAAPFSIAIFLFVKDEEA